MAATATGVPPLVPTFEIEGMSMLLKSSFDSAAFTKPTGVPMTRAGRTPFFTRSHNIKSADGAFPITMIDPVSLFPNDNSAAEVLVLPPVSVDDIMSRMQVTGLL